MATFHRIRRIAAAGCAALLIPMTTPALTPVDLRCEYRTAPEGIDETHPRLTWSLEAPGRGARQTAYRIRVAESAQALDAGADLLWDSGKVDNDRTVNIPYGGRPLASRMQCFWKVQVWDADGNTTWSEPSHWSMGLLDPADWQAEYISFIDREPLPEAGGDLVLPAARQYRREFAAAKPVKRAILYVTGLGIYECALNGQRVGDAWFAPGWTDYRQRAYYWTHDVTGLVREGDNALAAWVADGWYAGYLGFGLLSGFGPERLGRYFYGKTPALRAQLEIDYQDGTREVVATDGSWKVSGDGPIREADFLMGETYDARRESPGWDRPGFDDSGWASAILARDNGPQPATSYESTNPDTPGGRVETRGRPVDLGFRAPPKLEAFPGVPVRVTGELAPVAVTSPAEGVYIFNLGQNFAGVVRLKVKGPAGAAVQLRFGEMLHPDGRLMTENLRRARATDRYILRGDPAGETWIPRFTFHGFQYVEVTGYPGTPGRDAITGLVLNSDTPLASGFECSDPMANRLFQNVLWTQRANFIDLPTDCPQRDERFGWTGDAQIYVTTATLNADVAAFFTKWLRELMESQRPSGAFPGYAPFPFQTGWDFGTAWADAGVICPHAIWQAYDDTRIIERCWAPMTRFLQWRKDTSRDWLGVEHGNDWGDWLSFGGKTPLEYIDTVYFAHSARLMAEMARAIGRDQDAAQYDQWVANIREAFAEKYVRPDGSLRVDTQTAYVLALAMDLVPDDLRPAAGRILADKLRAGATADNSGMTTGFLGTRPLLPVLSEIGEHDLAVRHFQSRKFPSWGYEVEQGATTIWERWNSYTRDQGFGDAGMNSFAHYAFGSVCEWMFDRLAGISPAAPGWREIRLHPSPPSPGSNPERDPIHWVRAHHDSIRGRIACNWRARDGQFELEATIPANTTAIVDLPSTDAATVTESNRRLEEAAGIRSFAQAGDRTRIEIGAGTYRFRSRWPVSPD